MPKKLDEALKDIIKMKQGKKVFDKYYIPEYKIIAFFKAIEKNKDIVEPLVQFLAEARSEIDNLYTSEFLVILLIFRSFFQISTKYLGDVISAPENPILKQFFKSLTIKIQVSCDHLNTTKRLLLPIKEEFINTILKIEEDYSIIQQDSLPGYYREMRTRIRSELIPGAEKILELVPWHTYFQDSIFEWDDYYSPILMYKVFIWSRLEKIDGCIRMRNKIHGEIEYSSGHFHKMGQNIGFIKNIPGKTKLYTFFDQLQGNITYQTIENQARLLMKRNDAAHLILTIDSSTMKAQENDPGLSLDVKENSNRKKTHKIHAVCDGIGIPLQIHRTQGETNDMKGFDTYKPELIRLKKIADEENIPIIGVVIDAGYASTEILNWIEQELKVTPFPWPRNPRGGELQWLIHWLENLRKRLRRLTKLKRDTSPGEMLKDKVYCDIIEAIKTICNDLKSSKSDYARLISRIFLEIGIHDWFTIYRRRATIEGTFGIMKSSYHLLRRTPSQSLPIKGKENVNRHVSLVIIAMQINSLYRYLMLQKDTGILRPSLAFTLKELEIDL